MGLPEETVADAFAQLYAAHFRFVWSLAARLGVPAGSREDVAQEVWLTVHRRMHTLLPDASARGWVAAITRKVASRQHRTHHRAERKLAALAEVADDRRSSTGERDSFALVDDALARMDVAQREVFLLAHVEELSGPEIAEAVGAPLNTVYSRLRLARARLCEFLAQVEAEEKAIVEAIRRRDAPPRGASARVWVAITAGLGEVASVPIVGVTIATKLAIVGATAVTTILLVVGIDAAAQDPAPATVASEIVIPEPPAVRESNVVVTTSIAAPEPGLEVAPVEVRRPRVGARAPAPAHVAAAPESTIAAESSTIAEARRALSGGEAARAIALLDEHATKFPNGMMTVEARALRVRASCAVGRTDEARRMAAALAAEFPDSPSAAGVRDACGTR